jgi:hypothetical protein
MGIIRRLLIILSLVAGTISIVFADCHFDKPETVIGKADVLRVVKFKNPKKNPCFPNRGDQVGKIEFEYEFPEGSNNYSQVMVYYDSASHCYRNGIEISCSDVQFGADIGDVRYFERDAKGNAKREVRGVLNQLFVAP